MESFVEGEGDKANLYIVTEYIKHGTLDQYLRSKVFTEQQHLIIAFQIIQALAHLGASKFCHRDIKPENIMIANMNPLLIKLADFGFAKKLEN